MPWRQSPWGCSLWPQEEALTERDPLVCGVRSQGAKKEEPNPVSASGTWGAWAGGPPGSVPRALRGSRYDGNLGSLGVLGVWGDSSLTPRWLCPRVPMRPASPEPRPPAASLVEVSQAEPLSPALVAAGRGSRQLGPVPVSLVLTH